MDIPVAEVSTKYRLVTSPAAPATCIGCRRNHQVDLDGNPETWVDLTSDLDFYGAVLLCNVCAAEICRVLGYLPISTSKKWIRQINDLHEENTMLAERVKELNEVVRTLRSIDSADSGPDVRNDGADVSADLATLSGGSTQSQGTNRKSPK